MGAYLIFHQTLCVFDQLLFAVHVKEADCLLLRFTRVFPALFKRVQPQLHVHIGRGIILLALELGLRNLLVFNDRLTLLLIDVRFKLDVVGVQGALWEL